MPIPHIVVDKKLSESRASHGNYAAGAGLYLQERRDPSCSTVRSPNRWWMSRRSFPYSDPMSDSRASARMLRCDIGIFVFTETSPFPGSPAGVTSGILQAFRRSRRSGPIEWTARSLFAAKQPATNDTASPVSDEPTQRPKAPQDVVAAAVLTEIRPFASPVSASRLSKTNSKFEINAYPDGPSVERQREAIAYSKTGSTDHPIR